MKVYAYFESLDTIPLNNHTVKMWYDSWSKNGWEPIILGEADARTHPLYDKFSNAIRNFPSVNPPKFDYHAFMRWLAVPAAGGVLSTEPDVINYSLKPKDVEEWINIASDDILQCHSPVPSFLCGTPRAYEKVCEKIISHVVKKEDSVDGRPHLSDQDFSFRYCENSEVKFYRGSPLCSELFEGEVWYEKGDRWKISPCVHFGTPYMMQGGFLPKHEHIPRLRPL